MIGALHDGVFDYRDSSSILDCGICCRDRTEQPNMHAAWVSRSEIRGYAVKRSREAPEWVNSISRSSLYYDPLSDCSDPLPQIAVEV